MNNLMFAAIDGSGFIHSLMVVLIVGICALLIWWVGRWAITSLGAPPIAMTIWNGLFIIVGLIFIVNFLLSLIGHGFITI